MWHLLRGTRISTGEASRTPGFALSIDSNHYTEAPLITPRVLSPTASRCLRRHGDLLTVHTARGNIASG